MRLPFLLVLFSLTAASAAVELGTIASGDVLEPSVRNEVDHALSRSDAFGAAPSAAASACGPSTNTTGSADIPVAWTNGLSLTAQAVRLVSLQTADGRWLDGTNDVTRSAVTVLRAL